MNMLCTIAKVLAAVGALNWGLVAFLNFNLVAWLETTLRIPYLGMLIYAAIALGGAYVLLGMVMDLK